MKPERRRRRLSVRHPRDNLFTTVFLLVGRHGRRTRSAAESAAPLVGMSVVCCSHSRSYHSHSRCAEPRERAASVRPAEAAPARHAVSLAKWLLCVCAMRERIISQPALMSETSAAYRRVADTFTSATDELRVYFSRVSACQSGCGAC